MTDLNIISVDPDPFTNMPAITRGGLEKKEP